MMTSEERRLHEARTGNVSWKKWGPYLSERQWGTVREDYSQSGHAWEYFPHDQARSRAYRWGEDGLAGICDDRQLLCFSLALWNGQDSILKDLFYEYFHGDNGAGIGASHQTGWTGLVTWQLISPHVLDPREVLAKGFDAVAMRLT
jgi:hypothetical protein